MFTSHAASTGIVAAPRVEYAQVFYWMTSERKNAF